MKAMSIILGIETSCDETSVAVVKNGDQLLSNIVSSQIKDHKPFGGVVPELASRKHCESINHLLKLALTESNLSFTDIDAIAFTQGPGLEGSLLIGGSVAAMLSYTLKKPLVPINHMHGHIYAHFLTDNPPTFPFIALIASGGHTQLIKVSSHLSFELLGQTRDDAAGEAFDKVALALGLEYPGGPIIERRSATGDPHAFKFPIGLRKSSYEFSFSGLKTSVMQTLNQLEKPYPIEDLCASFQHTVIETLLLKSLEACELESIPTLVLAGGVMANKTLVNRFTEACQSNGIALHSLEPRLCTDNAAMIAALGHVRFSLKNYSEDTSVSPSLPI